jgi:hypothetical protein
MYDQDAYEKVKAYGPAGILSIILIGGLFWAIYIPGVSFQLFLALNLHFCTHHSMTAHPIEQLSNFLSCQP